MTEVELHRGSTLTLADDQTFWTDHQVAGLRQLGVDRASNGDLAVYLHVCQRTGLDPFARQIYMIERQGKQTIQAGIDGFRLVARRAVDRTGETLSIGASEWCDQDGVWTDVWLKDYPPAAARVVVYRNGESFPGTALWREYAQTKRDGELMAMWKSRPAGQLAKCAEALSLRKAFPHDLSGVYTDDELANTRREQRGQQRSALADALDPQTSPSSDAPDSPPAVSDEADGGGEPPITEKTRKAMFALMKPEWSDDEQREFLTDTLGRLVESRATLTEAEGIEAGKRLRRIEQGDPDAAWWPTTDAVLVEDADA